MISNEFANQDSKLIPIIIMIDLILPYMESKELGIFPQDFVWYQDGEY